MIENFFGLLKSKLRHLQKFQSAEHFRRKFIESIDCCSRRSIKAKSKGLPPAIHRQQALSAYCSINIAHSFKILRCSVSKSSFVSISNSSSARCACTQRTSCGWAFNTAPPPCPADRQRVQHRAHTAALGKVGGLGAAGNHHTVCKQAACCLQGVVQKGLCAKFGQQLAAPKVPP